MFSMVSREIEIINAHTLLLRTCYIHHHKFLYHIYVSYTNLTALHYNYVYPVICISHKLYPLRSQTERIQRRGINLGDDIRKFQIKSRKVKERKGGDQFKVYC